MGITQVNANLKIGENMGSTYTDRNGYKRYRDSNLLEHRVIEAKKLGHPLGQGTIVHHKDGNRSNNSGSNLYAMSRSSHSSYHAKKRR
jgi:hypothetical protein